MAHTIASRPSMGGWEFLSLRFVRVMPIYWLASLVMLVMLTFWIETPDWQRIVGGLLIFPVTSAAEYDVPVLRVGWSLTFEIAFYLAIALVISLVTKPSLRVPGGHGAGLCLGWHRCSLPAAQRCISDFLQCDLVRICAGTRYL